MSAPAQQSSCRRLRYAYAASQWSARRASMLGILLLFQSCTSFKRREVDVRPITVEQSGLPGTDTEILLQVPNAAIPFLPTIAVVSGTHEIYVLNEGIGSSEYLAISDIERGTPRHRTSRVFQIDELPHSYVFASGQQPLLLFVPREHPLKIDAAFKALPVGATEHVVSIRAKENCVAWVGESQTPFRERSTMVLARVDAASITPVSDEEISGWELEDVSRNEEKVFAVLYSRGTLRWLSSAPGRADRGEIPIEKVGRTVSLGRKEGLLICWLDLSHRVHLFDCSASSDTTVLFPDCPTWFDVASWGDELVVCTGTPTGARVTIVSGDRISHSSSIQGVCGRPHMVELDGSLYAIWYSRDLYLQRLFRGSR